MYGPRDGDAAYAARLIEELVEDERQSRLNPRAARLRPLVPAETPLAPAFCIVGAPLSPAAPRPPLQPRPAAPQILFQYPLREELPVSGLPDLCFPEGAVPQKRIPRSAAEMQFVVTAARPLQRSASQIGFASIALEAESFTKTTGLRTDLVRPDRGFRRSLTLKHVAPQDDLPAFVRSGRPSEYVFIITGHNEFHYGVCVYRDVIVAAEGSDVLVQPICFCSVTPVPYFRFHLDILEALLDLPGMASFPFLPPDKMSTIFSDLSVEDMRTGLEYSSVHVSQNFLADMNYMRIKSILEHYSYITVPEDRAAKISLFVYTQPQPLAMVRPQGAHEEYECFRRYGGTTAFRTIPAKVLMQLLAAILLEYKVVLVSSSKPLLARTLFSLLPILHPFEYQSSVITVLPLSLFPFIEAPVPILVGLTKQLILNKGAANDSKAHSFFIYNMHTGAVQCTRPLPALPGQSQLQRSYEEMLKALSLPPPSAKGLGTKIPDFVFEDADDSQRAVIIGELFRSAMESLVADFSRHCISEINAATHKSTSLFLNESFLATASPAALPFLQLFLQTQIFRCYEDKMLRDIDAEKNAILQQQLEETEKTEAKEETVPVSEEDAKIEAKEVKNDECDEENNTDEDDGK